MATYAIGSLVWVEDPEEAWIDGEVVVVEGDGIKINCTSGKLVVANASNIYPKDPEAPECGVDDMTRLAYLHEPGVLENLRHRYEINEIYTYTGNILIAVNPFRRIPNLYDIQVMKQYKGASLSDLSPHPFAIADSAYRQMITEGISQAILVSGESGAGKTESTKMLMMYLAFMGGRAASEARTVEQQVLESNPVLEAFGNAKTVRNNNSSRFGKFVEIQFDQRGRISGAAIRTYLLERSRVCQVSDPERNYHCFYMLCAAPSDDVERYKLGDPRKFHYLNQSNCFELDAFDDRKEYLATRKAMDIVGINSDDQDAIFQVVAAILHLGNIQFAKGEEPDSSIPKDDESHFHIKTAAELFMCDEKALEDSLCKRVMVTRDESITKTLNPEAAAISRDTLAKVVYSRLFDWIVNKINSSIGQDSHSKFLIGVLDIYGFESLMIHSFEQFCINLTNEKLQQHFNQHVFKMEQEEYTREEIDWSYIEFIDNQDVLDLIEKKPGGIIALLDEACMFPRSTHETFAEKLYQTFKDHKRFSKPKLSRTDFTICHYAGDVTYQTELFLDKNKDYDVAEHQALLSESRCSFIKDLFPPPPEESSKTSKFSSIGSRFKQQLQSLLETLSATEPHYIRCVKPNNLLKPSIFDNNNVLQQLRCGGVMEAIRISCAGYPTRKTFDEFANRFRILAPDVIHEGTNEVIACKKILEKTNLQHYQIGKTKVFLRAGQMAEMDALRNEVLGRSAIKIQSKYRSYYTRRGFKLMQQSAIQIQAVCRGEVTRSRYEMMRMEAACLKIQNMWRMCLAKEAYKILCHSAICIQAGFCGMVSRNDLQYRKNTRAAIIIQSYSRKYIAQQHYMRLRETAIAMQCACRREVTLRDFRKLKLAAKETGALQAAKTTLEKQVEELTNHLQLERQMKAELEEAKTKEITKLQSDLQETKAQLAETKTMLEETKAMLLSEHETGKIGGEQTPPVKEVPGVNQEMTNKLTAENVPDFNQEMMSKLPAENIPIISQEMMCTLTAENENLKALVDSLEKKIDESEKKYEELNNLSEERLQQAMVAESMIIELKTANQRLEEKLSDIEVEEHVLRQQLLTNAPSKKMSESLSMDKSQIPKNPNKTLDSDSIKRRSIEKQQENVDYLVKCVSQPIGFSEEKPVAAFTIYKCLLHWKSFEAEKTNVFDRLIQVVGAQLEKPEDSEHMAYWLSNTSTLLFMLQRSLKATCTSSGTPTKKQTSIFERMTQSFRSPSSANFDVVAQVDAKYPALLFRQQLTAYVETIYGIIRDNLKNELSSFLSSCVQQPSGSEANSTDVPSDSHWNSIIKSLNGLLSILKNNHVLPVLVAKIFTQVFQYINAHLFNSLLLHQENCTFSNGEYVKAGLDTLETWCNEATDEYIGTSWDELKHIRQAVGFLIIHQKSRITYDDITNDLCPVLTAQQLHRICTVYGDDNYETPGVTPDVISSLQVLMSASSNDSDEDNKSFLLEDTSSIPFSVEDISSSFHSGNFSAVKPAADLLQNPEFQFLHD
ncbi:hypothetical protein SAY86_026897 [Trapa natans]|uniref:Myosin-6-like n=1 Tax=Trapa natans TaxID=22666 RepID=A0AAN7KLL1_TRANT|nr:hypothetical protein SAY86_026897 [Trapa natans]